jgi:glycosyltransferase involved in cell wall biosynthesis
MAAPTHSVIVPVLDGERYIAECLTSILVQLGPHDELIVVDNGSSDGTTSLVEVSRDGRIVLLHEPKRGTPMARNTGLRAARGRYICFQDHDDLWPAGRQQALLDALLANPGANAAHGRQRVIFDGVDADPPYAAMDGQHALLHSAVTAMFERSLLDRVGLLDETMGLVADVDYLVRLRQAGMVAVACDADVHIRRRHANNSTSITPDTLLAHQMQLMHGTIVRRRSRT